MMILGSVQLIMLVWDLIQLVRGTPDSYHNEHLRSVATSISSVFTVSAMLLATHQPEQRIKTLVGWALIFLSLVSITWSFSLANGR